MQPQPNKSRILYTEDYEDTRQFVTLILERADYEVVTTGTVTDAMSFAESEHFDLYLLDTRLADGSGLELCKQIREFDSSTPILFFSAAALDSDMAEALSSGAQAYLTKPAGILELREAVSSLIARSTNLVN